MLYIAEVKKQTKLFMGGTKTVLHLLACQQNDNRWTTIPGQETITTEDVTRQFGEGALVTVNLGPNRQIQGNLELAGEKVANLLQTFSRQVEKTKGQEQEIEQWKQSLSYQAQELNRRQEALEEAEQQLAEKEEELTQLEQERTEIQQLREQWERDRAELEGAWEQLRGEQQRLETRRQEVNRDQQGLTEDQAQSLQTLLKQLEGAIGIADTTLKPLHQAQAFVNEKTKAIRSQWDTLDQQRQQADDQQQQAKQLSQQLQTLRQQLREKESNLLNTHQRLATVQSQLETKQQIVTYLGTQLQKQSEARDVLSRLVINSPQLKIQQQVDTQSLEAMPIEELEQEFHHMQKSFEDAVSFVKDQQEELDYQLQSVRELEEQLKQASESEQQNIENELLEERDRYRFLEKTLVGQRRNLMAREDILQQYQETLKRRQGYSDGEQTNSKVDLSPIFNTLDSQRDYSEDEFHQVNDEVETLNSEVEELQNTVEQQQQEYYQLQQSIQEAETNWQQIQTQANELSTRVEANSEILQQREQALQHISQKLEEISNQIETINSQEQKEQLSKVQELINSL